MKLLFRVAVAVAIVVSTWLAIRQIAAMKADAAAGGGTFVLGRSGAASTAFDELLGQLHDWGEGDLATSLARLRDAGRIWVAPRLGGGRSAVTVHALGLVDRIFVREDQLVVRRLPFPELEVPDAARRLFVTIRLAGTLFHELQHYEGEEDEGIAYGREIEWYEALGERNSARLEGQERRWFDWAVESALASAEAAREKAASAS